MRVKRGTTKNRKHKEVLKQAKGYRLSKSKLYRKAKEQLLHSGEYSFAHRKKKSSDFRRLWITRINAGLKPHGVKYKDFIHALKVNNIELNRKMLSEMAIHNPKDFDQVVSSVK
ncbi:50S ribosomal protein L20 [Candidatus Dojkabacteria bacterium]|uniref:Large ribosomal subunit protein bL20 n=1 Tax=Candidatus Dojkabacteria bacterium TaxID=2099670 RepID=A0A955RIP9_9BACT|nr:50S ribosomal protein L20 [Candidatus Dojkabacteria bacterium]